MATVGEIGNRAVVTVTRDATVIEAAKLMRDHHVGSLVVVDARGATERAVGIITDRDLVVEIMALDLEGSEIRVGEIMSSALFTARVNDGVRETLELMRDKGVRRVPIVSPLGTLIGIVTADDLIRALAEDIGALASISAREQAREAAQRRTLSG